MRRRDADDARWAAAASIARGRESSEARRFRRRAQWFTGSLVVLGLAAVVLVIALTPLEDQLFPPRGAGRTPAGWQIPLGIAGLVGGGFAVFRVRALTRDSNLGNRLPPLDPRMVMRSRQRRQLDGWIRNGAPPAGDRAVVAFDRALRFCTFPLPVWQVLPFPAFSAALTFSFRGPVGYLVAFWLGWAVAVLVTWWWGRRFREAAEAYVATAGMVAGPVTEPAPER